MEEVHPELAELLARVTGKRPRTVIDHILEHGFITTDDLRTTYGYDHPPRAARDVREQGIPLETFWVEGPSGRRIGAYRFGTLEQARPEQLGGRSRIPRAVRDTLFDEQDGHCAVCAAEYERHYFQVDHRVPFSIAGEPVVNDPSEISPYQLLCASCQRSKSWSCEHCPNQGPHDVSVCETCYWARPDGYSHVATVRSRRLDLTWQHGESGEFDRVETLASDRGESVQATVKWLIRQALALVAGRAR